VGLLPLSTLGAISRWQALGAKFVFFGDYLGQFGPLRDRWNHPLSPEDSPFLSELANGLHVELSTYRRGTDLELFNWFHGMYGQEDVRGLVAESRRRYKADCDPMSDPLVLCISHQHRVRVNAIQNARLAPAGATLLEFDGEEFSTTQPLESDGATLLEWNKGGEWNGTTMQPQSMRVWASSDGKKLDGITLIGCPRGSGKELVVQGVIYCVMGITETHLELQMLPEYCHGRKDEKASVPIDEACTQLRPAHAICYYSVQGRTVRDRHLVLLNTDHQYMSVQALIVGLSRATQGQFVHIGDSASESLFCGERRVRQTMP
jgi:hypothetical protein